MKTINLPESVIYVGRKVFPFHFKDYGYADFALNAPDDESRITDSKVEIPNTVKAIGEYVFYDQWDLKSIIISPSVSYIGDRAIGYYNINWEDRKINDIKIYR